MKRIIIFSLFCFLALQAYPQHLMGIAASSRQIASGSTLNSTLISYWKHDDASGNLTDTKGGHTGILTDGTPTYSVAGKVGTCITYEGASHFLVGTSTSLRPAEITISAWIKTTTSDYMAIATNTTDNGTDYYGFSLATELNIIRARVFSGAGTGVYVDCTTDITTGDWFHVVMTSDGANIKIFINGTQEGGDVAFPYGIIYSVGSEFDVAARGNGGIPWIGEIDELALDGRAWSQSEITEAYNKGAAGQTLY